MRYCLHIFACFSALFCAISQQDQQGGCRCGSPFKSLWLQPTFPDTLSFIEYLQMDISKSLKNMVQRCTRNHENGKHIKTDVRLLVPPRNALLLWRCCAIHPQSQLCRVNEPVAMTAATMLPGPTITATATAITEQHIITTTVTSINSTQQDRPSWPLSCQHPHPPFHPTLLSQHLQSCCSHDT